MMEGLVLESILRFSNLLLASANVIIGFSLFVYILTHNWKSRVARGFCALVACVTLTHVVELTLNGVSGGDAAYLWLRIQWAGIILVPAAYLHFSDAVLSTIQSGSRLRRIGGLLAYITSVLLVVVAARTDLLFTGVEEVAGRHVLVPGTLFWASAVYYTLACVWGWTNITRARRASLTSSQRRRMAYLMVAILAPTAGVLPFLLMPLLAHAMHPVLLGVTLLLGNLAVAAMTVVIAYTVAYQGVFLPDRVIKHQMLHFLMRGTAVAIVIVVIMLSIPHVPAILGLPRDTIMVIAVAGAVVALQVMISLGKPAIDRLVYRKDRQEIAWLQSLDQRLLTTTDLQQLLENTLVALCELVRAPSGFLVTANESDLMIRVFSGARAHAEAFLNQRTLPGLIGELTASRCEDTLSLDDLVQSDGHHLLPLRRRSDQSIVGIIGLADINPEVAFSPEVLEAANGLVRRAEAALEDMRLQQQVFALVQTLDDELDQIQGWRSSPFSVSDEALNSLESSPVHSPEFSLIVKDALTQMWGGPKLTQSALRRLQSVQRAMPENDNVPAKAMRAVLQEAIARLKPDGPRSMTSAEWLIYNILDLRFVQGYKIRDVVRRLAVSESDYYRKQRVAIDQVVDTLVRMEQDAEGREDSSAPNDH
ncbi:MAG: histidine kinase N-terminal 7TM domain-containing protein [Anaerolineae bacterium]|jgi:hypothetical protein|nr:hypothetical protein [Chloroflexota bacterium]